jgi:uncharacterized protein YprB with RNaseH-like and TPR domain/predicted nuclease with RNAse H fold
MKMLEHTFQHIPGYGAHRERQLWEQKIYTWDDYERKINVQLQLDLFQEETIFQESRRKFETGDVTFFVERLSSYLYYRIAHTFPNKTLFLDIETTGLSRYYNKITIVGWSILDKYKVHIVGNEETKKELLEDLANSSCIVTFNGSLFDIPFIKSTFPESEIPLCHIDLRFFSRRVSLQGGQKEIEKLLDINRSKELQEVNGFEATLLWHKYKEGDIDALQKLIEYNAADINGMKVIFEKVTRSLIENEKLPIKNSLVFPFSKFVSKPKFTKDKNEKEKIYLFDYRGLKGPVITLKDLPDLSKHKVVGIDLTGSETKASGWALLENSIAQTKRILSNDELINETIKHQPSIISIDSPLSLPFGRISVYDNDPGRNKYGITRECERIMAKRGVKSYPCLIQSMQKLTERGILLANKFRNLGFIVIESYPGAAQDILGIPRKRKSLEYLIKGLKNFGIVGDYERPEISHDEIDAITSALVGYFFLAGQYEALGNENEDYLIIPEIKHQIHASE